MWNHYRNKYSASKVLVDGIEFASKKEARHYQDLLLLAKAGEISDLQTQVRYVLIPAQREPDIIGPKGGKKPGKLIEKELSYIADFVFRDKEGNMVVQDVKGYKGGQAYALFAVKRKLMLWIHGIRVEEI
jgi:hypothetical protein